MTKRKMTNQEKRFVDAMMLHGCVICGEQAQFHHLPMARPDALAIGYPLCRDHHQGEAFPGQSVHSDRLLFCGKHGSELELFQQAMLKVFERSLPF